jgi:hypothetical protein
MDKKPLYRKVNTRTRGVRHDFGGDYRHHRNQKGEPPRSMARGERRGLDYTPLFRFLLSRVGEDWDAVYQEAASRLDQTAPIFWLVARDDAERREVVRIGESSYFSGLYIDGDSRLQRVAPEVGPESLVPGCACCTHTLNGVPFTRPFPG